MDGISDLPFSMYAIELSVQAPLLGNLGHILVNLPLNPYNLEI